MNLKIEKEKNQSLSNKKIRIIFNYQIIEKESFFFVKKSEKQTKK